MAERSASTDAGVVTPELMARVRQIQLRTRQMVSGALQGAYRSSFRGTGIEFEEVRPYLPGDEVRSIDWNVTARTGHPHIKTYVEERQLVLQLVCDTSVSMDFGSTEKTKRETAAEVCALLALVAAANQDQVGLALYSDEPGLFVAPDSGHRHVLRVVREVMVSRTGGRGRGLGAALEDQLRFLKRRSLVICVSDFRGAPESSWSGELRRLARKHDVVLARVVDPFEEDLPRVGPLLLEDRGAGRTVELDTSSASVRRAWREDAELRRRTFESTASRAMVDAIEVSTAGDVADPIVQLFHRRARRGGRR